MVIKGLGKYFKTKIESLFIVSSITLFLTSGIVLCSGNLTLANILATYGFYQLFVGFMLQIVFVSGDLMRPRVRIKLHLIKEHFIEHPGLPFFISGFAALVLISLSPCFGLKIQVSLSDLSTYGFFLLISGLVIQLLLVFKEMEDGQ